MNRFSIPIKLLVFLLFILVIFLVYLLFKRSSLVNNRLYKISNPKVMTSIPVPSPSYSLPNWKEINIKWSSADHPKGSLFKDLYLIEFTDELCSRSASPVCGFDEFNGTFEDVANSVRFALGNLDNNLEVLMLFNKDGTFDTYEYPALPKVTFNRNVPIRFIYFDGDKYTFPIANPYYSRGWGVDPNTKGIVVFLVLTKQQIKDWKIIGSDGGLFDSLLLISKISDIKGILNEDNYKKFLELWYRGDEKKEGIKPGDVATFKPIIPKQ